MDYKKALLTLLPHESKRIIAKGVKKIPCSECDTPCYLKKDL